MGKKAQEFILKNWYPTVIASKFLKIIKGEIPQEWYQEPINNYAHFAFIDENIGKSLLKKYIQKYGEKALMLDEKPELKKAFLQLINTQ